MCFNVKQLRGIQQNQAIQYKQDKRQEIKSSKGAEMFV